jgi:hypothetical protein
VTKIVMTKFQQMCSLPALTKSCADRVEFVINYRGSKGRDEKALCSPDRKLGLIRCDHLCEGFHRRAWATVAARCELKEAP